MTEELIIEAKEFLEYYKNEIGKYAKRGQKSVPISFNDIATFSNELADQILAKPEENIAMFELALDEIGLIKKKTLLEISIFAVNDKNKVDPENKSARAKPGKPAIYLEQK